MLFILDSILESHRLTDWVAQGVHAYTKHETFNFLHATDLERIDTILLFFPPTVQYSVGYCKVASFHTRDSPLG